MPLLWAAMELGHLLVYPRTNPFCGEMKEQAHKSLPCGTQVRTRPKQHMWVPEQCDLILVLYSSPCFMHVAFSTPCGLAWMLLLQETSDKSG